MQLPILYSYRRCPYAMRARMALRYAQLNVEIREISLREKPTSMLRLSPKGTVPVLVLSDAQVIEESIDIVFWALQQYDPDAWLKVNLDTVKVLIDENDGAFKRALDRYKYPERFPDLPAADYRAQGEVFLSKLEQYLAKQTYLLSDQLTVADISIFPFIRQFANVDKTWFDKAPYPKLKVWLETLLHSDLFESIMQKQPTYVD